MGFYTRRSYERAFFGSTQEGQRLFLAALAFFSRSEFPARCAGLQVFMQIQILVQANYSGAVMTPRRRLEAGRHKAGGDMVLAV